MTYGKYYYSLGLTGYELWVDDDDVRDNTIHVLFVGTQREHVARRYKIQSRNKVNVRQFVRVYGRRIYLDECMRV